MGWLRRLDLLARYKGVAPQWLIGILIGLAVTFLALLAREALQQLWPTSIPFGLMFPAILIATLLGRWPAGLTTFALGGILTWYLILPRLHRFGVTQRDELTIILVYSFVGLLMLWLADAWLRSERGLRRERELRFAEENRRQKLIAQELSHRIKNTLSTVQAIAAQTFGKAGVDEEARRAFDNRLAALARAHDLLTAESWAEAPIHELVASATSPFDAGRFRIDGPALALAPRQAVALCLALHELATNATKYGALSVPDGLVEIGWRAEDDSVHCVWVERGGPPVGPPKARGFGTRLLERGLVSDLGGNIRLDFLPDGLRCEMSAPLAALRG